MDKILSFVETYGMDGFLNFGKDEDGEKRMISVET
jgi:hypothetical protein